MGNITLSLPNDVQDEMKHFPEIKWSEVARKAIIDRIETMKMAEKLADKSKLTEKEVQEFSNKMKIFSTKKYIHANRH